MVYYQQKSDASGSIDRTEMIMSLKIINILTSYSTNHKPAGVFICTTSQVFIAQLLERTSITSFHCTIVGKNKAGLGKNSDFSSFFVNISL